MPSRASGWCDASRGGWAMAVVGCGTGIKSQVVPGHIVALVMVQLEAHTATSGCPWWMGGMAGELCCEALSMERAHGHWVVSEAPGGGMVDRG